MAETEIKQGILSVTISDRSALYAAYMPFVRNGGLFIATQKDYQMGEEVFLLLSLLDETERLPVAGKVVWKTPFGAQSYRAPGIGVQFTDQGNELIRKKIENYLAGSLDSNRSTYTM